MAKRRSGSQGKRLNRIESAELEVRDPSPSVEQILIHQQSQSQLRAALVRLPERTRRTIEQTLSFQNDGDTDAGTDRSPERARAAGVTPNAIRARLSRARSRLRQIIESMDPALQGMA
jgi:DNA-directed RNA polymerase specialized sigma24 family protein